MLHGGTYLAEGGTSTRGILNRGPGTSLEALGISIEAKDGSSQNRSLFNQNSASAEFNNSILIGSPVLYQSSGIVKFLASKLDGGIFCPVGGSLVCRYVVDEDYDVEDCTCP